MIRRRFVSRVTLRRDIVESFERYPFSLPAVRGLDALEIHLKMTILAGERGSGISTLLEAIAGDGLSSLANQTVASHALPMQPIPGVAVEWRPDSLCSYFQECLTS